ncbi:protein-disulfide reductase DsbD domain-containing protein, partial [Sphingomonas bacterium]|uniref:protein-disulfide reductase DsbD domain-containing protein n=1 Tax=Sphingomonas bacterium TaxID=1895847 RepID=UPI0020C5E7C8
MIRTLAALLCLLLSVGVARADSVAPPGAIHLPMTLVAETRTVPAGDIVTLAIDSRPAPGWHGYWGQNPGDAGFPPTAAWTLPARARTGAWRWPIPGTLKVAGLMNFVYDRPFAPLIDLRVPGGLPAGEALPVRLHLSYLVCTDAICVPEEQDLRVDLTVGVTGARDARFDGWRRAVPRPLGAGATYAAGKDGVRLAVPYPAGAPLADAFFFPATAGAIDNAAAQTVTRDGDRLLIATTGKPRGPIDGVLRIAPGQGLAVHAVPGDVPGGAGWVRAALIAFAGAVLGGLILNVMPCVFPILSLKALSLARSGTSAAHARSEALAYTAGVVLVCVALGGIILALRAGGTSVGWAFQLQNPLAVLLLFLLTAAIAFNLAGLFELPTPPVGELAGKGGAFMTGALAALIATPCSGPFMGTALFAALLLPWPAALAVFAGLGIGLALPFLLVGFVPALRARLPRPGAWMDRVRHVLAVPMFLTAIALGYVLGREAGVAALTLALALALLLAVVLWAAGG